MADSRLMEYSQLLCAFPGLPTTYIYVYTEILAYYDID